MNCKTCKAQCTGAGKDRELVNCPGYEAPIIRNNEDMLKAKTGRDLARELAAISGFEGNKEQVDYFEWWLKQEA